MVIFRSKPWVNPFRKMTISRLFELLVFIVQKGVFFVLEYRKRHFPGLYYLKKNLEKWPFLDQKKKLTPLEKNQFFDFKTSCFYSLERLFFGLGYRHRHFPCLYCLKKKLEKWSFLDKNHGLTPLKKCQFFDFLNLLFIYPRKAFFPSRIL